MVLAVLGVGVGSFLNVVIDRVPHKVPLRGPHEGEVVPPREPLGVPLQPWVLRGGRAGGEPLPVRWLLVELATALVFGILGAVHGDRLTVLPLLVLGAALVAVSVVDLQLMRIPDRITFPALALAVPTVLVVSVHYDVTDAFRGALIGAAAYFVLLFVPHLVYPRGMGFGDVKLALLMGLFLGWVGWRSDQPVAGPLQMVLYGLMLGCVLGVVFGVVSQLVTRRRGEFPFGPALALACLALVVTS